MRWLRITNIALLATSITLAGIFYYQQKLQSREIEQYQQVSRLSAEAIARLTASLQENSRKLEQNSIELKASLDRAEKLSQQIAALEQENSTAKGDLEALKQERGALQNRIASLVQEKTDLENKFASLEKKFHSIEELKKAITIAKIERRQSIRGDEIKKRIAKIEMLQQMDEIALAQGNRGYAVKDGKTTFRVPKVSVELEPITNLSSKERE